MKLVLVVGAATPPGRLNSAVAHLAAGVHERRPDVTAETINLASTRVEICDGRKLEDYDAPTRGAVEAIAAADGVLLAAPVYRASFPGVLKNFLDLLPVEALRDKPVAVVAMGGSPHHYLAVDAHLRLVLSLVRRDRTPEFRLSHGPRFCRGTRRRRGAGAADLAALGDALVSFAEAVKGRSFGPVPLAARFT